MTTWTQTPAQPGAYLWRREGSAETFAIIYRDRGKLAVYRATYANDVFLEDCGGEFLLITAILEACERIADLEKALAAFQRCRGCGKVLLDENKVMCDGCPCNSPRGVNHGIVGTDVCTCVKCDPAQTGASRFKDAAFRIADLERRVAAMERAQGEVTRVGYDDPPLGGPDSLSAKMFQEEADRMLGAVVDGEPAAEPKPASGKPSMAEKVKQRLGDFTEALEAGDISAYKQTAVASPASGKPKSGAEWRGRHGKAASHESNGWHWWYRQGLTQKACYVHHAIYELLKGASVHGSHGAGYSSLEAANAALDAALLACGEIEPERCDRCGWPLYENVKDGCTKENCSQRPLPPRVAPSPEHAKKDASGMWELLTQWRETAGAANFRERFWANGILKCANELEAALRAMQEHDKPTIDDIHDSLSLNGMGGK